ncbi:DUF1534 domain-containing protein [Pseudomonas syringae pv. actinidiae]|nr:DUF1534 domain-containing protein [Pseudomonas syringae pv. actinidiae]
MLPWHADRDALRHKSVPHRASRSDAERRTIVEVIVRTLQRRNAVRDALRHRSASHR